MPGQKVTEIDPQELQRYAPDNPIEAYVNHILRCLDGHAFRRSTSHHFTFTYYRHPQIQSLYVATIAFQKSPGPETFAALQENLRQCAMESLPNLDRETRIAILEMFGTDQNSLPHHRRMR